MSHIDTRRAAARFLVTSLDELGNRLATPAGVTAGGASFGINYCEACDVPDLALTPGFFAKLEDAVGALENEEYLQALQLAAEMVEIIRTLFSATTTDNARIELYMRRLFLPLILDMLRDAEEWSHHHDPLGTAGGWYSGLYLAGAALMMLDRPLQENLSDAFIGHRVATMFGQTVADWKEATGNTGWSEAWPHYVVDGASLALAVTNLIAGDKVATPATQFWSSYGWEPAQPNGTPAEAAAGRSFSIWMETHPEFAAEAASYAQSPDEVPPAPRGLTLVPLTADQGGAAVVPFVSGDWIDRQHIGRDWYLDVSAGATPFEAPVEVRAYYDGKGPMFSLGDASEPGKGRSLELGKLEVIGRFSLSTDSDRNDAEGVIRLSKAKFSLGRPDNSFLGRLLPNGISGTFNGAIGASARGGFYWEGGLGTEIFTPVDWSTSEKGIQIPYIRLKLKFKQDPEEGTNIGLEAGFALKVRLGPLTLGAEPLGASLTVANCPAIDGNLGPLAADWELTDPRSVSLQLDAATAKGEGFLAWEPENDRWMGALRIVFARSQLDGVVLVEGGSLLAITWIRNMGIPLPGGTLEGMGFLLGVHRRGDRDAFLRNLKNNALDAVLFPSDPVGQAPQIIGMLGSLFPRAEDHAVMGLMLRASFGGKARIVVIEVGVIAELGPSGFQHVYVLGQGEMRLEHLPPEVFCVRLDLFADIDLAGSRWLVRAELRDSRLAGGDLTGGGILLRDQNVVGDHTILSFGGFNPRYTAPPDAQGLARIACHLANRENLKIYFELYFALTSCSIQIGGKLSIYAGIKGFSLEGYLAVDLLARFDGEFYLDVALIVAIRRGSRSLLSLEVIGCLSGSSTWRLTGKATIKLLFFKVTLPVEWESRGGGQPSFEPADALATLRAALEAPESWSEPELPADVSFVSASRDGVWVLPNGRLRVSQTALPLGETITRLGASPLSGPQSFEIQTVRLAGQSVTAPATSDRFNLGLYRDIDLDEAVRAPFIEHMQSGVDLNLANVTIGAAVAAGDRYEEIFVDDQYQPVAVSGFAASSEVPLTPLPPEPDPDEFYAAPPLPFAIEPPSFVVADGGLQPQMAVAAVAEAGTRYTTARDQLLQARARGQRRYVVRRHEVSQ